MVKLEKWLICILYLNISLSYCQQPENRIAVLNLEFIGAKVTESDTLTDRLRNELANTKYFTVIEQREMDAIFTEHGFQQTGCISDSCAVKMGRLLNIKQICVGNIVKVDNVYLVTLRMIDTESEVILFTATEECPSSIEQVLSHSMKNLAVKLVGLSKSKVEAGILKGQGDIHLKSEPTSAEIFIDGKKLSEVTPMTIHNMESGEHMLKVVKGDFIGNRVITVIPNDIIQTTISLSRDKGGLKVYSSPAGADIYIENKYYGKTPKVIQEIAVGDYLVFVKKTGYLDATNKINVSPEAFAEVFYELVKPAILSITSQPSNAEVILITSKGKKIGKTPLVKENLYPEKISVEVSAEGYAMERRDITLREADKCEDFFSLKKLPAIVIRSVPVGARVYVNDEYKGISPLTIHGINESKVRISLKKAYFNDWQGEGIFTTTKDQEITATLTRKTAQMAISSNPSGAQIFLSINDKTVEATTPYQWILQCGEYEITLKHPQCKDLRDKVILEEEGTSKTFQLDYKTGTLKITGQPVGSTILINGQITPYSEEGIELSIDNYEVIINHFGYVEKKLTVPIEPEQIYPLDGSLTPKTRTAAVYRSMIFPGFGQHYQEKKVRRFMFPTIFIGAAAASFYYGVIKYNDAVDSYNEIRKRYEKAFSEDEINLLWSQMNNAYDDIQDNKDMRNYFLVTSMAVYFLNVLDALFLPAPYEKNIDFSYIPSNRLLSANIKFSW
jgi:hypothetical protein